MEGLGCIAGVQPVDRVLQASPSVNVLHASSRKKLHQEPFKGQCEAMYLHGSKMAGKLDLPAEHHVDTLERAASDEVHVQSQACFNGATEVIAQ